MRQRLDSLDYLRGTAAILVMLYHYTMGFSNYQSEDFMMRMGYYAVSIFYILSGLTLYLVYKNTDFIKITEIKKFFIKRILRIYPLFILSTAIAFFYFGKGNLKSFILNITGLFSVFDRDNYLVTGAWSIGNELIFYLFFPILMILLHRNKYLFFLTFLMSIAVSIYFNFNLIDEQLPLKDSWYYYIHPFNQIFFFITGIAIAYFYSENKIPKYNMIFPIIGVFIFIFYPVYGNSVKLISDIDRVIFYMASTLVVMGVYNTIQYNTREILCEQ